MWDRNDGEKERELMPKTELVYSPSSRSECVFRLYPFLPHYSLLNALRREKVTLLVDGSLPIDGKKSKVFAHTKEKQRVALIISNVGTALPTLSSPPQDYSRDKAYAALLFVILQILAPLGLLTITNPIASLLSEWTNAGRSSLWITILAWWSIALIALPAFLSRLLRFTSNGKAIILLSRASLLGYLVAALKVINQG